MYIEQPRYARYEEPDIGQHAESVYHYTDAVARGRVWLVRQASFYWD